MAEKRLVVVVDGTAAMGPYWRTIVSDYLEKITRHFCGESMGKEPSGHIIELGVVMYKARGPHGGTGCLVQCSSWTKDIDRFLEWLLAFSFDGGGHDEAAIAEGLADALVMFPKPPNRSQTQQHFLGERHCILVAASNPFPLPMPLHLPKIDKSGISNVQTNCCMADAKTVAGLFTQCFVSLSVISPKKLPKLRELYNAGNDPREPDPSLYNIKNPQFLVLLSENFLEARAALGQHKKLKEDITMLQQLFDESSTNQQNVPAGNIIIEAPNNEPKTVSSVESQPTLMGTPQNAPNSSKCMLTTAAPNASVNLKNLKPAELGTMSNKKQGSCQSNGPSGVTSQALAGTPASAQNTTDSLISSTASHISGNFKISQPTILQTTYAGIESAQNTTSGLFTSKASMVENSQHIHGGMESTTATADLEYKHDGYVMAWEGAMSAKYQGQTILLSRLRAYRKTSTPETLTSDWPQTLQMGPVIAQRLINKIPYNGQDFMIFEALNNHQLYQKLKERELCVRINLPSQTMIFTPTDRNCRFVATLFPKDFPLFKP